MHLPTVTDLNYKAQRARFEQMLKAEIVPYFKENSSLWKKKEQIVCTISYAWGNKEQEALVEELAEILEQAGLTILLDRWYDRSGLELGAFIEKMFDSDYILVIGTPPYLQKYERVKAIENNDQLLPYFSKLTPGSNEHVLRAEVRIMRYLVIHSEQVSNRIIPLLWEGTKETALPFLLRNKLPRDFVTGQDSHYFEQVLILLKDLYQIDNRDKKYLQFVKSLNVAVKVIEEAALQARGQYEAQLQQEKDVQAKQEAQKASSIIAGFLSESSPKRLREKELDDPLDIKRQKKDSAENSIYQQQSLSHDLYQLRLERMQDFAKQALEAITFIGNNEIISHQMLREQLRSFLQQIQTNMTTFANLLAKKQNKLLKDMYEISWKGFQQKAEEATNSLQAMTQGLKEPLDEAQAALLNKMFHKVQKIYASDANLTLSDMKRFLTNKLIESKLAQLTKRIASFPSCFISYSWGPWGAVDMKHTAEVHRLARYLKLAGVNVILDIWDNQVSNIPVFTGKLFKVDKVLLIGSTHLLEKWENYCSGGQSRGRTGEQYSGNVIATELTHILKRLNEKPQDQHGIILALFEGDDKTSFPKELGLPVSDTNFASADYLIPLFHLLRRIIPQAQHTIIHQLETELTHQVQQLAEEEDKEKLLMTYQQFKQQQSCVAWDKELLIKKVDDDKTPSSSSLQANSLFKEHLMDKSDSPKVGENKNVFL